VRAEILATPDTCHEQLDDPFTDASGAELFAVNHAALTAAGVRVPRLIMLDRDGQYLNTDIALVEDVGTPRLETLMERDPSAAAAPLSALGTALQHMHTTVGPHYGKLAAIARGEASQKRRAEDIIVDRGLGHLDTAAARDSGWPTRTTALPSTSVNCAARS
jgi:hypothetical protein